MEQLHEAVGRALEPDVATPSPSGERKAGERLDRREVRVQDTAGIADEGPRHEIEHGVGTRAEFHDDGRRDGSAWHVDPADPYGAPLDGARVTRGRWLGQPETSGTGLHPQRPSGVPKLIGPPRTTEDDRRGAVALAACALAPEARR